MKINHWNNTIYAHKMIVLTSYLRLKTVKIGYWGLTFIEFMPACNSEQIQYKRLLYLNQRPLSTKYRLCQAKTLLSRLTRNYNES
ncbi:MAG: hypothetical protein ACI9QN_000177 [Arcticibacterium sp.]|jgi:hypothetical protein